MCDGTCFASYMIGHKRLVPPARLDNALLLVEMPGSPQCLERVLGSLGPVWAGKLLWGPASRGAARNGATWCSSVLSGGCGHIREARQSEGVHLERPESVRQGRLDVRGPQVAALSPARGCSFWARATLPSSGPWSGSGRRLGAPPKRTAFATRPAPPPHLSSFWYLLLKISGGVCCLPQCQMITNIDCFRSCLYFNFHTPRAISDTY